MGDVTPTQGQVPMRLKALFICNWRDVEARSGGVQTCTREYLTTIARAGIEATICKVDVDGRAWTRVMRRLGASPYYRSIRPEDARAIRKAAAGVDVIFCNQVNLLGSVSRVLSGPPTHKRRQLIGLSHGCEITDMVHEPRGGERLPIATRRRTAATLGRTLQDEVKARRVVDGIVCLSESDLNFERWLGAPNAIVIPRVIALDEFNWTPAPDRFGFVGTLDHTPNLEGLVAVLDALHAKPSTGLTIRVVSGSTAIGDWLKARYPFLQFLGGLSDDALKAEAQTWRAFLNPIFAYARGASTKLSLALGWQLPTITTPHGRRGYVWTHGSLIEAETPSAFADTIVDCLDNENLHAAKANVEAAASSAPPAGEIAMTFARFVDQVRRMSKFQ
jgi:hypothetical protein